jgi:hypothetical protein
VCAKLQNYFEKSLFLQSIFLSGCMHNAACFHPLFATDIGALGLFAKKNSLFLKKSNVRFFQKQAVFFGRWYVPDNERILKGRFEGLKFVCSEALLCGK